jgi:uncharacterized membrane protein YGL010W
MTPAGEKLSEYGARHGHPANRAIHRLTLPLVYLRLLGLLSALPSYSLHRLLPGAWHGLAHFGTLLVPFALLYYLRLSVPLALVMMAYSALCLALVAWTMHVGLAPWKPSLALFLLCRLAQAFGQRSETGKLVLFTSPEDLLLGPAWALRGK